MWSWGPSTYPDPHPRAAVPGDRFVSRRRRPLASLAALAILSAACSGGGPPAPAALGERVALGPFTLTVSRVETVPLTETFSRTGEGLGLALFVELSLPEPDPAVTAEIAMLKEEASRVGQAISNLRFTRRNADDSELTARLVEVVEKRERLQEEAYRREPRTRLFRRGVHVVDGGGEEYRPGGYATEETYDDQMRFRRGSAERPFTMLASTREDAGYPEGASEQEWVLLFRLPPTAHDLTVVIENPDRQEGQPRSVAVPLGGP